MQAPAMAPAPAIHPTPVAIQTAPVTGTGPDRTMMIHTGLIVVALVLALLGVMGDAWSVEEQSQEALGITVSVESEVGLADMSATSCVDE